MPRRRERSQLGEIVYRTRRDASLEQNELAEKVGSAQPRISDLEGFPDVLEKQLDLLRAIEDACGQTRGHIFRKAGYVDDQVDVRSAIATDPELPPDLRETLLAVYDKFRDKAADRPTDTAPSATPEESARPSPAEKKRLLAEHNLESARPKRSTPGRADDRAG